MFATSHLLLGGAVGAPFPNLFLATTVGFLSHFFLDAIPHWDFGVYFDRSVTAEKNNTPAWILACLDVALGLILTYFLFAKTAWLPFLIGAFAGLLPDVVSNLHRLWPGIATRKAFQHFQHIHQGIHCYRPKLTDWWWGASYQIALWALVFAVLT